MKGRVSNLIKTTQTLQQISPLNLATEVITASLWPEVLNRDLYILDSLITVISGQISNDTSGKTHVLECKPLLTTQTDALTLSEYKIWMQDGICRS